MFITVLLRRMKDEGGKIIMYESQGFNLFLNIERARIKTRNLNASRMDGANK